MAVLLAALAANTAGRRAGGVLRAIRCAGSWSLAALGRVVERRLDELRLVPGCGARVRTVSSRWRCAPPMRADLRGTADNAVYGYGTYEVRMRTGRGSGLNAAFFTYIGPVHDRAHHEIDIEVLLRDTRRCHLQHLLRAVPPTAGRPRRLEHQATRSSQLRLHLGADGIMVRQRGARTPHGARRADPRAAAENLYKPLEQRQFSRLDGALRRRRPYPRNCISTGSPSPPGRDPASSRHRPCGEG
jgi:hypothetical protein